MLTEFRLVIRWHVIYSRNYGRFWRFILRDYPVKPLQGPFVELQEF